MPGTRILFTTPFCSEYYDYFRENVRNNVARVRYPRINSYGLRFIRQNLPSIEILEYPTWDEYLEVLSQGWDIVGFSFFNPDFFKVKTMAEVARRMGVSSLWGGSYGALIPEARQVFDELFMGYAEGALARRLEHPISDIMHPPIVDIIGDTTHGQFSRVGVLFTSRGCPLRCSFCQSPTFSKGQHDMISLKSIQRTLEYYEAVGVSFVLILDETFGLWKDHTKKVVPLLKDSGLPWLAMTRTDILGRNVDQWLECGMQGALLGIENVRQKSLDFLNKRQHVHSALDAVERLLVDGKTVIGFYMIGLEHDTIPSVKEDIRALSEYRMDLVQVCVMTPLHRTPLWNEIATRFGGIDPDLSKHDMKTLVWNHPAISVRGMSDLLSWCFGVLYPPGHLEYARAKWEGTRMFDVRNAISERELSRLAFFDDGKVVEEDRRSPCRFHTPDIRDTAMPQRMFSLISHRKEGVALVA